MQSSSWQPVSATKALLFLFPEPRSPPWTQCFYPCSDRENVSEVFSTNQSHSLGVMHHLRQKQDSWGQSRAAPVPGISTSLGVGTWVLGSTGLGGKAQMLQGWAAVKRDQPCCGISGVETEWLWGSDMAFWDMSKWGQFGVLVWDTLVLRALEPSQGKERHCSNSSCARKNKEGSPYFQYI